MSDRNNQRSHILSSRRRWLARFLSPALNAAAILLALRFLMVPAGTALFLPFDGAALAFVLGCGLLIALPLSIVGLVKNEGRLGHIVGACLSLTPVPAYMLVFWLINETKHFRFQ